MWKPFSHRNGTVVLRKRIVRSDSGLAEIQALLTLTAMCRIGIGVARLSSDALVAGRTLESASL
jgi:hypothetical protein